MRFFATAAKGTEPALRDELRELRLRHVRADRGGVHFEGDLFDAARACLWSRVAVRVLLELGSFAAPSENALYDGVRAITWDRWMSPRTTLAVRAACRSSHLTHSQYVAQKTKDAVVDVLRERCGARPSVDRADPDVGIAVHLARDLATIYLDVGGASLHARGWRGHGGAAPLRETLAAAVLRLSGWDPDLPIVDPMCGAGTIAIEAAARSCRIAPGLSRPRFGLERWASCDEAMHRGIDALRQEARASRRKVGAPVRASDVDPRAVEWTRHNAAAAGVDIEIELRGLRDLRDLEPAGFVVTNPPYGERLDAPADVYRELARCVERMRSHTIAILAGTPEIARGMRPPDRWWILYNGDIECRLLVYGPAPPMGTRPPS
ncbi:MAG TPA: THUMP domain-containing protein [Polyangiaceae bacterium]|nr:THUMP domain-containing protein [Polyangiaceae bacterium]